MVVNELFCVSEDFCEGLNDDMPNGSVVEPLVVCCVPNGLNAARKIHIYNSI